MGELHVDPFTAASFYEEILVTRERNMISVVGSVFSSLCFEHCHASSDQV